MSRNAFRRRDSSRLDPEFIDQAEHDGLLNPLALRLSGVWGSRSIARVAGNDRLRGAEATLMDFCMQVSVSESFKSNLRTAICVPGAASRPSPA
jgi:hypothetical protein